MMFKILPCVVGGCLPHSCNMGNILNINSVKILVAPPPPCSCCSQAAAATATTALNWHRSASATAVAATDKLPQLPPCCRHCRRPAATAKHQCWPVRAPVFIYTDNNRHYYFTLHLTLSYTNLHYLTLSYTILH